MSVLRRFTAEEKKGSDQRKGDVLLSVRVKTVEKGSPAARAGIREGDLLVSVNGHGIADVLDYDFYTAESSLSVVFEREGVRKELALKKGQYTPLGLDFETYLMDKQRRCANTCVFCFIDQLPKGMRESLYFKDDDVRLSFLLGNYVTMTNFSRRDVERIVEMKISPINVSVHTTNPALRIRMLGNKNAGRSLEYIDIFRNAGIRMNAQIVVCPGLNDGEELERTLHDLVARAPEIESIAMVPVGLTAHREGLCPLEPVTKENARDVIARAEKWAAISLEYYGEKRVYASDEFYIKAELPIPDADSYGDFPQLENGVGMIALLRREFDEALEDSREENVSSDLSIATGEAAGPFIRELAEKAMAKYPGLTCRVHVVPNRFFGGGVTVAGLLTGRDLAEELSGKELGNRVLIVRDMLKAGEEVFLDDMTPAELEARLGVPVTPVENDGAALFDAMIAG
ncbi:MAG: DUF512 domain-containing protein [Clostridia bacterium]|nr:DUF512 domain-containing protein [Clostridia bacterium]